MHSRPRLKTTHLVLLLLLSMLLRVINLDHEPHWDEFYHYFAAKSAATDGTLQIDAGEYTRASLFTYLVGGVFYVFGPSFVAARLVSVVAGSLAVVAVAVWAGRVAGPLAGPLAGIIAGLLMCFSGVGIEMSQFARFYALHGLCIWLGAVAVYAAVAEPASTAKKAGLIAAAAGLFLFALHLQPTTVIALLGLSAWLGFWIIRRWCRWAREGRRRQCLVFLVVPVAAVAMAAWLCRETIGDLLHQYRWAPAWLAYVRDDVGYYHRMFLADYRMLYGLLPLGLIVGLARKPKPTAFCLCVFVTALLVHSGAGQKQPRLIAYAVPFLFAAWGIILSQVFAWITARLGQARLRPLAWIRSPRPAAILTPVLVVVVAVSVAATNRTYPMGLLTVMTSHLRPSWKYARPVLEPLAASSDVVVSSTDLKPLYYLGRSSVVLGSQYPLDKEGSAREFSRGQTGRPVITRPESLDRLVKSRRSGLVIIERDHWRRPGFVSPGAAEYLARHTRAVPLPKRSCLIAFRWDRSSASTAPCDARRREPLLQPHGLAKVRHVVDQLGVVQ